MDIEQVVPYSTKRSFDDFTSGTCFHSSDPEHSQTRAASKQDLFYLLPKNTDINQEHYLFGQLCLRSHTSLFIDIKNQSVDKWNMVHRFPGLWDFFSSSLFRENTLSFPTVFWHAPKEKHDEVLSSIKNSFLVSIAQQDFHEWDHDIHSQLIAQWDEDDWPMAFRLSAATIRSVETCLHDVSECYLDHLDIDNIDIEIHRRRQLRKIVIQQVMQNTLIAKLMTGMQLVNDTRADITRTTIINQLVEQFDLLLAQAIKQHLGK